jgi:hypothetical protein
MLEDQPIKVAILQRRLVEFKYHRSTRVLEPHVLGIHRGVKQLFGFQIDGQSRSGKLPDWRRFDVEKITEFNVLDDEFPGGRPYVPGRTAEFDVVSMRVD